MNEEFSHSNAIDTELQVRLMNLVMGEASDFECDQLQLMMEQRAEVAAHYQHIKHLHGLLSEVGTGEASMDSDASVSEDAWQLSADRREQVLAVLDGVTQVKTEPAISTNTSIATNTSSRSRWAAAGVLVTAASLLLCLMLLSRFQTARNAARKFNFLSYSGTDESFLMTEATPAFPSALVPNMERGAGLPNAYYRADDVQYFAPAPSKRNNQPGSSADAPSVGLTQSFAGKASGSLAQSGRELAEVDFGTVEVDGLSRIKDLDISNAKTNSAAAGSGTPDNNLGESFAFGPTVDAAVRLDASDDYFSSSQLGRTVDTTKPDTTRFGNGRGWEASGDRASEAPKTASVDWERGLWAIELADIAAVSRAPSVDEPSAVPLAALGIPMQQPSRGTSLDTIANSSVSEGFSSATRDYSSDSSTHMMTVTPKMMIPAGEEKVIDSQQLKRSVVLNGAYLPGLRSRTTKSTQEEEIRSQIENELLGEIQVAPTDSSGKGIARRRESDAERVNELDQRLAEQKESLSRLVVEESVTKNKVNTPTDAEASVSNAGVGDARLRMSKPTPSPEVAASNRERVALEAKLAERKQVATIDEQSATAEAFSTFSLHVSDVSFKLAQASLSQGQWPEAAKIRIEEFVNALDYHDPLPSGNQKVACRVEQAIHPFLMQRNLLRVSMRTAATGRSQNTPLRLTLLLDNSGSMERPDRRLAVVRAFQTLTAQLSAADQVTLISFASTPRLLADKVPGNQGETLLKIIENLPSEGGTNIEAALMLAREKAIEQQLVGAQNRIVLLTDGAVNLGDASPDNLARLVTQLRDDGIAFDAAGISAQDLNDEVLEALTRRGDGRYYLLDSAEAASESFAAQIAGALRPSAQNVKVQVEFNPQRVGRYKLLGFEKHLLNKEDFRNDKVDAAELSAAEAGVAVYQFEIKPNGKGDVGSVSVRFRDLSTNQMVERRWPIPYEPNVARLEKAEASMQLAAAAALFAAKLSGGPIADSVDLSQLHALLSNLPEQCASQPRVQQLRAMMEQAKAIGK